MNTGRTITCFLTGATIPYENDTKTNQYEITIAGRTVEIIICRKCYHQMKNNKYPHHVINGLIANGKFPGTAFIKLRDCEHLENDIYAFSIEEFIETAIYPKTPKEKLDSFFLYLIKGKQFDGQTQQFNLIQDEQICVKNYFLNRGECGFYFQELKRKGWIEYQHYNINAENSYLITHAGLNAAIELQNEGKNSNKCFIAMAFKADTSQYRNSIKKALNNTGFEAILIDEEHLQSDKTIPDGILAGIKKSRFCIADFTYHRNGVYFESGFALGLGKQVIYICRKDEFENAHFDIKQLQHIIYENPIELEKRLIEKIEAWIK